MGAVQRKITIVDDSPEALKKLSDTLEFYTNYDIHHFLEPEEAFEDITKVNSNSLIMIDCKMPNDDDGFELYKRIRSKGIECPIMLFSCEYEIVSKYEEIEDIATWTKDFTDEAIKKLKVRIDSLIMKSKLTTDVGILKSEINILKKGLKLVGDTNEKILDKHENFEHQQQKILEQQELLIGKLEKFSSSGCCELADSADDILEVIKKKDENPWVALMTNKLTKPLLGLLVGVGSVATAWALWFRGAGK